MKTLILLLALSSSAMALDFQPLTVGRDKFQAWVVPGGMLLPANEVVANQIEALKLGKTNCQAKYYQSAHSGTHAYIVYDLKDCQ